MTLIADIQQDIIDAFDNDLAEFVFSFDLTRTAQGAYNSTTGQHADTETDYPSRGTFEHYKTNEINKDMEIKASDTKLTIVASELSVAPEVDDVITKGTDVYTVINFKDIFGVAYECQLRGI